MRERTFSFEFFPPRTEAAKTGLVKVSQRLQALRPDYVSVTFGAGGSTQQGTYDTVKTLLAQGFQVAPHISCIGTTRGQLQSVLRSYMDLGVKRIVALRGDLPSGNVDRGDFRYANELVAFIREETGDHFYIEVAAYPEAHPQAESPKADMDNFARKVNTGANAAITQYFYNADAYFYFVEQARAMDIDVPIVPGIMPIINYKQLARFSDACEAEIPMWIRKRLQSFGDDTDAIRAFGHDVVVQLCQQLLDGGAPGLHFYTLNLSKPTIALWEALGLQ